MVSFDTLSFRYFFSTNWINDELKGLPPYLTGTIISYQGKVLIWHEGHKH